MIGEADLAAVERWFAATLDHCRNLRADQRHIAAENCAHGALKLMRVLHETQAVHGFFAELVAFDEGQFLDFVCDESRKAA